MTQLIRALSEQMATATPSPSVVASDHRATAERASAPPPQEVGAGVANPPARENAPPSVEALKAAARQIEEYLERSGRKLEFSVDEPSGRLVVTVRDALSGNVIRQIPNDEALRLARTLGNQPNVLIDILI